MKGHIDHAGRSLLRLHLRADDSSEAIGVDVWVDTGFTGELVLPRSVIERIGLDKSGSVDAILADGTQIELTTYTCVLNWFGADRKLEVIANDGEYPLLGVGLLLGFELRANYRTLRLSLR